MNRWYMFARILEFDNKSKVIKVSAPCSNKKGNQILTLYIETQLNFMEMEFLKEYLQKDKLLKIRYHFGFTEYSKKLKIIADEIIKL